MPRRRKLKPRTTLRFRAYDVVDRAVDEGVGYGWRRAHKYLTDGEFPTEECMLEHMHREVMNALCGVLDFDPEDEA